MKKPKNKWRVKDLETNVTHVAGAVIDYDVSV
jgi:hypothetical protein